ncbi:MAG: hypothetical protein PHX14_01925 [Syntrophomonadaceae bacterium]|nr:hypothetical protein [Syntrophomonadaceae bacterium]
MKKYFPMLIFLMLLINIIWIPQAVAGEALWQLFWADDNALLEYLTIDQEQALNAGPQWERTEKSGKVTLNRETKDWQAYKELSERLPLEAQVNDYIVFRTTTLKIDKSMTGNQFLQKIMADQGARVVIEVPGYIKKNPVGEVKELTVNWELQKIMSMKQGEMLLQTYTLNGFYLGVVLFGIGFISVAIFFIIKTRRVDRLINERYSLDRIGEEDDEIDNWK